MAFFLKIIPYVVIIKWYDLLYLTGEDPGFWERGGSDKYIHNWGEGTGGGVPPPVTARGFWGSADSSPEPQPLFCFCVYLA